MTPNIDITPTIYTSTTSSSVASEYSISGISSTTVIVPATTHCTLPIIPPLTLALLYILQLLTVAKVAAAS